MSTAYDYTRELPETSAEEYVLPEVTVAQSGDDIERENTFKDVPPGDHLLVVKGFDGPPAEESRKAFVNGRLVSFRAAKVGVILALPDDERATVRDYFMFPPSNPAELIAYYEGTSKPDGKSPGFESKKFFHFIDRLGWPVPAGGKLPEGARKLANWKGRTIHATVQDGDNYTDKNGNEKKGFNRVKLFSYRPSEATMTGRPPAPPTSSPAPAATRPAPASRPAPAAAAPAAALGLNDL